MGPRRSSATWSHAGSWDCRRREPVRGAPPSSRCESTARSGRLAEPARTSERHQPRPHRGLAELFPQIDADDEVRAVVLTGNGRAFSAGGDFAYLDELTRDAVRRRETLAHGKQIVTGMVSCRVPIVAAVNGPAVGLGCSLVALSDIVYMAESAHLADPHVLIGLVAADGGPVTWPLLTSLQLAKEYALTGDRIPARRAAEMGLVNHVCADGAVLEEAVACAQRIARLPRQRWRTPSASSTCTSSGPSSPPWTSPWPPRTGPSARPSCGRISTGRWHPGARG